MKKTTTLLWIIVMLTVTACWRATPPPTVYVGDPDIAYAAALEALRADGYYVLSHDPKKGRIAVAAKLDGRSHYYRNPTDRGSFNPHRVSRIVVQVFDDGSLDVTAEGHHVMAREKRMHRSLRKEVEGLQNEITQRGHAMRAVGYHPPAEL